MVRYREALTPSLPFHLALLVVIPMGFGMLAPIDVRWGIASAITLYAIVLVVFVVMAPRIVVTDTELRAGRAHIPLRFVGTVTVVPREDRTTALADARTWRLLRAWIPTALVIDITDPDDPTPAWFLSTRRPDALAAALKRT